MSESAPESPKPEKKKRQKLTHEALRNQLWESVRKQTKNNMLARVGFLLDQFPETRNSDRRLIPAYWKEFDSEKMAYRDRVTFEELMVVTQYTSILRARQKIQNEFGLFIGDEAVREQKLELAGVHRKKQKKGSYSPSYSFVICDESGKEEGIRLVGSVWIAGTQDEITGIIESLKKWKTDNGVNGELSFKDLKPHNVPLAVDYIGYALTLTPSLAFKSVGIERKWSGGRDLDDIIFKLHFEILSRGIGHELTTGRVAFPRTIILYKDKDDVADMLNLPDLRLRAETHLRGDFDNQVIMGPIQSVDSAKSDLVQLTDLITGSINRVLNVRSQNRNHKDEAADAILALIGLKSDLTTVVAGNDKARHFQIAPTTL